MIPTTIIGIKIDPVPTDPRALALFNANFPVSLPAPTTDNDMTWQERQWCTAQILGHVRLMIVNGPYPYADKFCTNIASRVVDIAAVWTSAQDAAGARDVLQDATSYTDGMLWGVGDPASTNAPPNYIPGMASSISYSHTDDGYEYPPGNTKYDGPYSAFNVVNAKGTKGPTPPYPGNQEEPQ